MDLWSFVASGASIVGLVVMWARGDLPVPRARAGPAPGGLSAFAVSSSQLTLTVMLIIAVIGVPIMLAYTALVYRVFAGKTVAARGVLSGRARRRTKGPATIVAGPFVMCRWRPQQDSNLRPSAPEADALSTEL